MHEQTVCNDKSNPNMFGTQYYCQLYPGHTGRHRYIWEGHAERHWGDDKLPHKSPFIPEKTRNELAIDLDVMLLGSKIITTKDGVSRQFSVARVIFDADGHPIVLINKMGELIPWDAIIQVS